MDEVVRGDVSDCINKSNRDLAARDGGKQAVVDDVIVKRTTGQEVFDEEDVPLTAMVERIDGDHARNVRVGTPPHRIDLALGPFRHHPEPEYFQR
jgi:hypothetical protein